MSWLETYDLFLFDLDGLLVNTEQLHFEAYSLLARRHGFDLGLNFVQYCAIAHRDSDGLRRYFISSLNDLVCCFPDWKALYEEKCQLYLQLLLGDHISLMPGVERLFTALAKEGIPRAIVTHSRAEQVSLIREKLPLLNSIPLWITREHYDQPKPAPDGYLFAIKQLGSAGHRTIGFEDTLRGVWSLVQSGVQAVMVTHSDNPHLLEAQAMKALHLTSLDEVPL